MTQVKTVEMAPNGPTFSELVQGYWRMADWGMSTQEQLTFLEQHLELGITTVDHAHVYGGQPSCEELFGDVLKLAPNLRERIEIVSKFGIELVEGGGKLVNHYNSTPSAIAKSVDLSLSRLGVEKLDVLLVHRPDWLMDVDAMADSFAKLRQSGKVQHFGVSNFTASQFTLLQSSVADSLITNQIEINPLNSSALDDGCLDQLSLHKIRPMAWSCLAGGRIFNEESEQIHRLRLVLTDIAKEVSASDIDQVVYAWVMKLPSQPVAILGSGNIDRVKTAVASLAIELSHEQWYRIWVAAKGHNVP